MKWWVSAAAQWSLAHLPGGVYLHRRLQERYGELARLEHSSRFDNALWFLRTARRWCGELGDLRVVELGTGWVPALPLAFLLSGASVDTFDVQRLVRPPIVRRTIREISRRATEFAAAAGVAEDMLNRRLAIAADAPDFAAVCRSLRGSYRAPFDTLNLPYADESADLVVSNLVLQCIPTAVLEPVLKESLRVLRAGGLAIHRIRMTDEYSAADRRRHDLAYLQFSQRTWQRWFCHRLKQQNRLRASQFLALFEDLGGRCRLLERDVDHDSIEVLKSMSLAAEFRDLELEDVATINLDIVVQRPPTAAHTHRSESPVGTLQQQ